MSGALARVVSGGAQLTRAFLGVTPRHLEAAAGFKVRTRLKLRCHACYFIRVDGRMHVECNLHPRHKTREVFNVKLLW